MTRSELEHLIRAAATIAEDDEIVVIGSQAILGQFPDAPKAMRISVEADLFPLNHPDRAELIDGTIGELSPFHETFGYYAHGVAEDTAFLPASWKTRLVVIQNANTRGAQGLCLEIHDLLAAKALAGREKDVAFLETAAEHSMADLATLNERLAAVAAAGPSMLAKARSLIERSFGSGNT